MLSNTSEKDKRSPKHQHRDTQRIHKRGKRGHKQTLIKSDKVQNESIQHSSISQSNSYSSRNQSEGSDHSRVRSINKQHHKKDINLEKQMRNQHGSGNESGAKEFKKNDELEEHSSSKEILDQPQVEHPPYQIPIQNQQIVRAISQNLPQPIDTTPIDIISKHKIYEPQRRILREKSKGQFLRKPFKQPPIKRRKRKPQSRRRQIERDKHYDNKTTERIEAKKEIQKHNKNNSIIEQKQSSQDESSLSEQNLIVACDLQHLILKRGIMDWQRLSSQLSQSITKIKHLWRWIVRNKFQTGSRNGNHLIYSPSQDIVLRNGIRNGLTRQQISQFLPGRTEGSLQARAIRISDETIIARDAVEKQFVKKLHQISVQRMDRMIKQNSQSEQQNNQKQIKEIKPNTRNHQRKTRRQTSKQRSAQKKLSKLLISKVETINNQLNDYSSSNSNNSDEIQQQISEIEPQNNMFENDLPSMQKKRDNNKKNSKKQTYQARLKLRSSTHDNRRNRNRSHKQLIVPNISQQSDNNNEKEYSFEQSETPQTAPIINRHLYLRQILGKIVQRRQQIKKYGF